MLQAIRLGVPDRFQYVIDTPDGARTLVSDAAEAARKLSQLGVPNPEHLVEHVQLWGVVEIVERSEIDFSAHSC